MKTPTAAPKIFVVDTDPSRLMEMSPAYYSECQIAGASSVEVELLNQSVVVISATRYLPEDAEVAAVVTDGRLQVLCTRSNREPVIVREFTDWTNYTVRRAHR